MGRWHPSWLQVQHTYLQFLASPQSTSIWLSKVISQLWSMGFALWEHRNAANVARRDAAQIAHATAAISEELEARDCELHPRDRPLFHRGPIIHDGHQLQQMQSWLVRIQAARSLGQQDLTHAIRTPQA